MNRKLNILLRLLGEEKLQEINSYVSEVFLNDFCEYKDKEQVLNSFGEKMNDFSHELTDIELMDLRSYTGYNFKNINAILRGSWNYEENGLLNQEVEAKYRSLARNIENIIDKFPKPDTNFVAFRGVEANYFSKYGIISLNELVSMKDKFIYEEGFTSTSILKDTSYFGKSLETGKNYNVEIKYLISSDSQDGALLMNSNFSYSPNQNEFLINVGSLSKVIDVNIDYENSTASLTVVLVPKKLWNIYQLNDIRDSKEVVRCV